jgi:hypothetical protein
MRRFRHMARNNRFRWLRWPLGRKPTVTPDQTGAASSYIERQMEARRNSPEWPEVGGEETPPNLPRSTAYSAVADCHRTRVGRGYA